MLAETEYNQLEKRIGRYHLTQRLRIQDEHVHKVLRRTGGFFHVNRPYSFHSILRMGLRMVGLHKRGRRNATNLQVRRHTVELRRLPPAFDGFTLLHLSDLHLDLNPALTDALIDRLREVRYDVCVITGDFCAWSLGPQEGALMEMARVRPHLRGPVYGVLGNHDFIELVPRLEDLGITMLINESVSWDRDGARVYVAGIDDPHYYRLDNLEKAVAQIPPEVCSILLSHAPGIYRWAARADFDLMLCGHTHGGQVCLPGGKAFMFRGRCPRRMGAGAWQYHQLQGYTSTGSGAAVLDVRFNCPPEITLHHLKLPAG
jgi:predicted MPP superfamily phosphohydrolase